MCMNIDFLTNILSLISVVVVSRFENKFPCPLRAGKLAIPSLKLMDEAVNNILNACSITS